MKTLGIDDNFLSIEQEYSNLEDSRIAILLAPYEYTVSYGGGTAHGPKAIIDASHYVEFYDDEFDTELCFDKKISTLTPLVFSGMKDKEALNLIQQKVAELLKMNKFVVTLGGEHTISQASIKAHYEKYQNMSILHFDAHSDLRDEYDDTPLSHACIMARVSEFFPIGNITQVGIRAQSIEEAQVIKENKVNTFYASAIRRKLHGLNWQKKVCNTLGDEIYITFDVDYFDPSIMPSTGTPEPDGFLYSETLDIFREIIKANKKIIGFDVVELSPIQGLAHPDLTTARLIYKMLNFAFK